MTARHTFNLGPWLTRLGLKGGRMPDVIEAVQPVQVVGDASSLVSTLLPPTAGYGGPIAAVALEYGATDVLSLSPGGSVVQYFSLNSSAAVSIAWRLASTALTLTGAATLTPHTMQPTMLSQVRIGTVAAIPAAADIPYHRTAANVPLLLTGEVFIPVGQRFQAWITTANAIGYYALVLQDLPAAPGAE